MGNSKLDIWRMRMKKYDKRADEQNILESLKNDNLKRNDYILNLISLLNSIEGAYTIALDGQWGSGKTFFVKKTKFLIELCNKKKTDCLSQEEKEVIEKFSKLKIKSVINESINLIPLYFDAWKYDSDEDALLSFISFILYEVFEKNNKPCIKDKIADSLEVLLNCFAFSLKIGGISLSATEAAKRIVETLKNDGTYNYHYKDWHKKLNDFLDVLLPNKNDRLVIFVDELDRCRPLYTVQLLERITHYFDIERIIFVFSVNTLELQNTIKVVYGENFSAVRYCEKFFDLRLTMPSVNEKLYFDSLDKEKEDKEVQKDKGNKKEKISYRVQKKLIQKYNLQLRDINRFVNAMDVITCFSEKKTEQIKSNEKLKNFYEFAIRIVVPLLEVLLLVDCDKYFDFVSGNSSELFTSIICDKVFSDYHKLFFGETSDIKISLTSGMIKECFEEVYKEIFEQKVFSKRKTSFGNVEIPYNAKEIILDMVSLMPVLKEHENYIEN